MNSDSICCKLKEMDSMGESLDNILETAVKQLHDLSGSFNWTGIYELFPDDVLKLGPFVGPPTDHVFITVGQGVCGSAVAEKQNKNIPDVSKEANYLACSSSTRSELVVLIRKDDRIFAQIDIDSNQLNAFDDDTVREVQKVADCLAEFYAKSK